jgi:hypothetical protein
MRKSPSECRRAVAYSEQPVTFRVGSPDAVVAYLDAQRAVVDRCGHIVPSPRASA